MDNLLSPFSHILLLFFGAFFYLSLVNLRAKREREESLENRMCMTSLLLYSFMCFWVTWRRQHGVCSIQICFQFICTLRGGEIYAPLLLVVQVS
jgi:hypothetical protein